METDLVGIIDVLPRLPARTPFRRVLIAALSFRRAIRYHPKRMRVEIDQIPCNSAAEVSLTHYTGKEKDEGMQRDEDPWWVDANSF